MIKINKNKEPNSLLVYRKSGGVYNNIPANTKIELRKSLLKEQGYICCYCLKRIPENKDALHHTKIEHFKSQANNKELELDYSNLHIACKGSQGRSIKYQTCDTAKADQDILSFSLIDNSLDNQILYASDGTVLSEIEKIDKEINEVLHLNSDQNLKKARKKIRMGLSNAIKAQNKKGNLTKAKLNKELISWKHKSRQKYREFYPVAVQYLEKKIEKYNL